MNIANIYDCIIDDPYEVLLGKGLIFGSIGPFFLHL